MSTLHNEQKAYNTVNGGVLPTKATSIFSQSVGGVTCIGSRLYSKFGANYHDVKEGCEYFAAHGHNHVIMVSALESLIHLAKERIREKHL